MKILCDRQKLSEAFQTATLFAPKNSPKPILNNVKLEVVGESATLLATDIEVGVRQSIEGVNVSKPGSAILAPASFGSILREATDEKLQIEVTKKQVVVKGERCEFRLDTEPPEEFPSVAEFAEEKYSVVSADALRLAIGRTEFATDDATSRFALGGICIELSEQKMIAVGCDGKRLAKVEYPAESIAGHKTEMSLIPGRAAKAICRAIASYEGQVKIACRQNDVLIQTERASFYARLVEGRYPRWRDVIPSRSGMQSVELAADVVMPVIRQAAIMTSQETTGVNFQFSEGLLALTSSTAGKGEARIDLPVSYSGEKAEVTLSHPYVAQFLKVLDAEANVTLHFVDANKAALLTTDDWYEYVVMPLSKDR